jgi:hypothetical protein
LAFAGLSFAGVLPAAAYKWSSCPPPLPPLNPSEIGATTSPFAHPGREISIVLNQDEVDAHGGFRTDDDGNDIAVRFASLFGDSIELTPRNLPAVSSSVLTFSFPDARAETGRTLAGPVEITVSVGGNRVAHILPADFIGLPAAVDFDSTSAGDAILEAALGPDGDLWIPVHFLGKPMGGMPGCDGEDFIMPMPLEIGGALLVGDVALPLEATVRIRRMSGYLGDISLNGTSYYGLLYPEPIKLRQVGDTLGVSVCRLNDADDLVLRVQGNQSWTRADSPLRLVARDSSALALTVHKSPSVPKSATGTLRTSSDTAPGRIDSFGNQCAEPLVK